MDNAVHSFLPTDLPALVAHAGIGYENEAWPRERLGAGEGQATLTVLRDQLLAFTRQRGAWVSVRRQRLQGLVGARQRGGNEAWEIDYLIDATRDGRVTVDLLECAVAEAGKEGAHKLFLRLPGGSNLLQAAREAGFVPYQEETLYAASRFPSKKPSGLRRTLAADSYPLFRLYCEATPETTRRLEAVTFAEWHAAQERRWLKNGLQLILERDGRIRGSLKASRLAQGVLLDVLLADDAVDAALDLVAGACQLTESAADTLFVLVPASAEGLAGQLESAGFVPRQDFLSLMRRTARPLAMPTKVAVVAKNALGV